MLNLFKSPSLLDNLDWNLVVSELSAFAYFTQTKSLFHDISNLMPISMIEKEFDILEDYLQSLDFDDFHLNSYLSRLSHDSNFHQLITMAIKESILSFDDINSLVKLVQTVDDLTPQLGRTQYFSTCFEKIQLRPVVSKLVRPFRKFVDEDGTVHFERHPDLAPLFKEIKQLEEGLRNKVLKLSQSDEYRDSLQFSEYDNLNDTFVLAIKSDSYRQTHGIIKSKSNSGMTLFIEPTQIRDDSYKIQDLQSKLHREIIRICREFTKIVGHFAGEFSQASFIVNKADFVNAKALYTILKDLVRPELDEDYVIECTGFFHPLLKNPVKNNLFLNSSLKGLVISGPNTGGKTVAMKSIALIHIMARIGLYVPAKTCRITLLDELYIFCNDQQNIADGLSSFAAETKNYLELLAELKGKALIVIDEIYNSTSSDEASALALGLLTEISSHSNTRIILSTHHQLLKSHVHTMKEYLSCHVGISEDLTTPTYKLYYGEPGSSMAFNIFERLSSSFRFNTSILQTATGFLSQKQITYDRILQDISQKKGVLEKKIKDVQQKEKQLDNEKDNLNNILALERQKYVTELQKELSLIRKKAYDILENTKNKTITNEKTLALKLSEVSAPVSQIISKDSENTGTNESHQMISLTFDSILLGGTYYSSLLKHDVQVMAKDSKKQMIHIAYKNIKTKCKPSSLHPPKNKLKKAPIVNVQKIAGGQINYDCRGMKLNEFQNIVYLALADLELNEVPYCQIVHGHGDGILKNWLRKHLMSKKHMNWRSDDGNDGATIIELNKS